MSEWRILIVEDDPDGQEMVATMLDYMNFPVEVVDNAEAAMELIAQGHVEYRAIIIDLALPGMDGWELLAHLQEDTYSAHIPCIAVTAFHTFKLREDAIRAGFSAYLPKPLDGMALGRELERLMA
jgi:CheY-like chemotaxis protein